MGYNRQDGDAEIFVFVPRATLRPAAGEGDSFRREGDFKTSAHVQPSARDCTLKSVVETNEINETNSFTV